MSYINRQGVTAAVLAGYVPYTGATSSLDMGLFFATAARFRSDNYEDSVGNTRINFVVGAGGYWSGNTELQIQYSVNFGLYNNSYYVIDINAGSFALRDPSTGYDSINVAYRQLSDGTNTTLSYGSRELRNSGNNIGLDWGTGTCYDGSGSQSIRYQDRYLVDQLSTIRVDWENGILRHGNGNEAVVWSATSLNNSFGSVMADWGGGTLQDSGLTRLSWTGMELLRGSNVVTLNWDLGFLYWNNGSQHVIVDWSTQSLFDIADQYSIRWGSRLMYASDGSTVILNYNNSTGGRFGASIQVGRTDTAPVAAIHVDKGNATASALKFTVGTTTGQTASDGFDLGVTTAGVAEIRQRENLDLVFYTNNTESGRFSSGQRLGVGTGSTVSAKLHTLSTTEQLRLGYDAANYSSFTVDSAGSLSVSPTSGTTNFPGATTNITGGGSGWRFSSGNFAALGSGHISLSSGSQIQFNSDAYLTRDSAATIQVGLDAATPVAQTFKAGDARAGTDTNVVGSALRIAAGRGTGTGGGGILAFQTAPAGASGTAANTLTTIMSIDAAGDVTFADATDLIFNTTTGTKIGTATSQKQGFWNATPIVQPTTAVAAATFVTNTSLIANDTATFDGYTIGQVVKALRNTGLLA